MEEARKLLSDVITKLAQSAAQSIADKAKDYFVDRENKEQIDTKYAYEDYLAKVYDTYSKSRTIVYGDKEKELSSFFVPVDLRFAYASMNLRRASVSFGSSVSTRNIAEILKNDGKLIITGIGGMGKTMLMKHFCINAIENGYQVPVFISLRRFSSQNVENAPFEKLIFDQLKVFGFKLEYKYFEYSLESDRYLFLFDGYDEISSAKKAAVAFALSDFAKRYSKNSFIISSRDIEEIYSLDGFLITKIAPMNLEQAVQLIGKLDDFAYESKKRFIDDLKNNLYNQYNSFASIPLLLSILFLTYHVNTKLPETLSEFYEKAFETLMFQHDRRKLGFERVFKSGLSYESFRKIFIYFCFITYFKEDYSFVYRSLTEYLSTVSKKMKVDFDSGAYIDDMVNISCMLIKDGQEYVFLHRSFQEYFAAYYASRDVDEKLQKLCYAFINTEAHRLGREFDFSKNTRLLSFLDMLYSIETKRFTAVIARPILEKIYKEYTEDEKDLVSMVRRLFIIDEDIQDENIPYFTRMYFLNKPNSELTLLEINIFRHVYRDEIKNLDIELDKEVDKIISDYSNMFGECELLLAPDEFDDWTDNYHEVLETTGIDSLTNKLSNTILAFIVVAIKKYEELVLEDTALIGLESIVDTY